MKTLIRLIVEQKKNTPLLLVEKIVDIPDRQWTASTPQPLILFKGFTLNMVLKAERVNFEKNRALANLSPIRLSDIVKHLDCDLKDRPLLIKILTNAINEAGWHIIEQPALYEDFLFADPNLTRRTGLVLMPLVLAAALIGYIGIALSALNS